MRTIYISQEVTLNQGVTPDEGKPIYDSIREAFENGEGVTIDFKNITLMTTAFLNVVIGTLYKDYPSDFLRENLKFENLSNEIAARIKKVADTAKAFYANEKGFESHVNSAINDED